MVNTRRRRIPDVVPESEDSEVRNIDTESVRDIDIEPVIRPPPVAPESSDSSAPTTPTIAPSLRSYRSSRRTTAAPSLPPSIVRSRTCLSPATPPGSPPHTPPPLPAMPRSIRSHRSPSAQSAASFAGPGQRGAQLLARAPNSARNSFLNAFDALNDEFAAQLRQRGVPLHGGKFSSTLVSCLCSFVQFLSSLVEIHLLHLLCHPCHCPLLSACTLLWHLDCALRVSLGIRMRVAFVAYAFALPCLAYAFALPSISIRLALPCITIQLYVVWPFPASQSCSQH